MRPEPLLYKGWEISQSIYHGYEGLGPDYDASYEGPEDGWIDNGQFVHGKDIDEVKSLIDDYIEEHP